MKISKKIIAIIILGVLGRLKLVFFNFFAKDIPKKLVKNNGINNKIGIININPIVYLLYCLVTFSKNTIFIVLIQKGLRKNILESIKSALRKIFV